MMSSIMLKKMVGEDEQLTIKSKVDLSWLPACRDNLVPHISHLNHCLACYKRADKPIFWHPKPYDPGQGWEKTENCILEPVWSCGPILPPSLTVQEVEEEEEEEEDEHDIDYDEILNDDN